MALHTLQEVKVGSLIQVGGVTYRVSRNTLMDLELHKSTGYEGISQVVKLSDLIPGVNYSTYVQVVGAPANGLTDSLRKQISQSSLTDSLRAQVKDSGEITASVGTSAQAALTASLQAQKASKVATSADLRAQAAENQIHHFSERVGDVQREQEIHADVIDDLAYHAQTVSREVRDLEARLEEIEDKQYEEEQRMNLQAELNNKLALQKQLNESLAQNKTGGSKMKNLLGSFTGQFGKVEGKFAFSALTGGLALRKGISSDFVAYNVETGEITDVQSMVLDFKVPAFSLPVQAADVKKGDIVRNGAEYGYVTKVADGYVEVVLPESNKRGSVLPTTNLVFGKPFYTVVRTIDAAAGNGSFDPMLLMALGDGNKDDILPFLLMGGGLGKAEAGTIDPMTLMLLKDKTDDLLPLLLMQQGGVAAEGFNPLMLLALDGDKGSDLLPLLMMQGGTAGGAGAINPMMLSLLGDSKGDMKDILLMQALGGGNGLFPAAPVKDVKKK